MTEFDRLKNSYTAFVQSVLVFGADKQQAKILNELLHKRCEFLVDRSYYSYNDKMQMKQSLSALKHQLGFEIDSFFNTQTNNNLTE